MLDARATSAEIGEARPPVAVIGIGAVEQHSHHLPVGTDWIFVSELSRRVAERLGAYCLPALPFSMSQCHGPSAGTVWLRPETLAEVVRDLILSLAQTGVSRFVIVNGHGGNFVLESTIQELNLARPSLRVIMPSSVLPGQAEREVFETADQEVHAGESETSFQLYLNGEHVKSPQVDFVPPVGREFLDYAYMLDLSPEGVWGVPSPGTTEKGERAMALRVESVVRQVQGTLAEIDRLRPTARAGQ